MKRGLTKSLISKPPLRNDLNFLHSLMAKAKLAYYLGKQNMVQAHGSMVVNKGAERTTPTM